MFKSIAVGLSLIACVVLLVVFTNQSDPVPSKNTSKAPIENQVSDLIVEEPSPDRSNPNSKPSTEKDSKQNNGGPGNSNSPNVEAGSAPSPVSPNNASRPLRGNAAVTISKSNSASSTAVAKIVQPTKIYESPGSKLIKTLSVEAPIYKGAYRLLVVERRAYQTKEWLRVLIPDRPNQTTAWLLSDDVLLMDNPYRIVVDVSERKMFLLESGKKIKSESVVVGSSKTPTPVGTAAVLESVPQPEGDANKLGAFVIALTSHSNVHKTFDGGDGRIGIHAFENLGDKLGSATSNGCIRVSKEFLLELVETVEPGTPVVVVS